MTPPSPRRPMPVIGPELIDANAPTPLYHQIYTALRERIRSGALPAETVLPGEQELTRALGVSRITIKRALNELASQGLVRRQRGHGTVVVYNATSPVVKGSFDNLIDSLRQMGVETTVQLVDVAFVPAAGEAADALGLPDDALVQRAVRVRRLDDDPFSHLVTFVPQDIAERYSTEELATKPLLQLLERAGAKAYDAEQTISATAAEAPVAAALRLPAGAPLLRIQRVMRDRSGRAVQYIVAHYRPERFQYQMRMTRRGQNGKDVWGPAD